MTQTTGDDRWVANGFDAENAARWSARGFLFMACTVLSRWWCVSWAVVTAGSRPAATSRWVDLRSRVRTLPAVQPSRTSGHPVATSATRPAIAALLTGWPSR